MASLLKKADELFGHVMDNTPQGAVYRDDGSLVDFKNPRPCFSCKLPCKTGEHDPCIANLPNTSNACCGHGLELTPNGNLPGYVALDDGRAFHFSGTLGPEAIRVALDCALRNEPLPYGLAYDEVKAWWTGMSDKQRAWVLEQTVPGIAAVVLEVTGNPVAAEFLEGRQPWWEGLTDEQKEEIWRRFPAMVDALAAQAWLLPAEEETPAS